MSVSNDELREEILKAIKSVVDHHAEGHHPGEKYRVTMRDETHEIMELQTQDTDFEVIEDVVEKNLPESLMRIAKEHHRQHHKEGEEFQIGVIQEKGLAHGIAQDQAKGPGYRKGSSSEEEEWPKHEQEEEIMLGCNCGWQASMSDLMGPSVAEENQRKYGVKKGQKKSMYAGSGSGGSGSANYGGKGGSEGSDYKGS